MEKIKQELIIWIPNILVLNKFKDFRFETEKGRNDMTIFSLESKCLATQIIGLQDELALLEHNDVFSLTISL